MIFNDGTPITNDEFAKRIDEIENGKEVHSFTKATVDSIPEPIASWVFSHDAATLNIVGLSKEEQDKVNSAYSNISTSSITASIFHKQEMQLKQRLKSLTAETVLTILDNDEKRKDCNLNRIVSSAMRAPGSPMIISPRHWDSIAHSTYDGFKALYNYEKQRTETPPFPDSHEYEQGFIDRNGEFKTRQEAYQIALAAGQIIRSVGDDSLKGGTLYSENLY